MKRKHVIWILGLLITVIALSSCSSQERFGQRKAPKDCNCTRWSK